MYLLRVALPDRPGSLGAVATALGHAQADINAVEVVEKYEGYAVDDFMLDLAPGAQPDSLITACGSIEGVQVLWMSFWARSWALQADVDVLNRMTEEPERAEHILTENAPAVFHVDWATLLHQGDGTVTGRSELAPDVESLPLDHFATLTQPVTGELAEEWLPGWPEALYALAPTKRGRTIVIARKGGPEFLPSEVARLRHLASLA